MIVRLDKTLLLLTEQVLKAMKSEVKKQEL